MTPPPSERALLTVSLVCFALFFVMLFVFTSDCAAQTEDRPLRVMGYALVSSQLADVTTTLAALDAGHREANPSVRLVAYSPLAFAGMKATSYIVTDMLLVKLAKKHRRAALVLGWTVTGFYSAVAIHNARIARKDRP